LTEVTKLQNFMVYRQWLLEVCNGKWWRERFQYCCYDIKRKRREAAETERLQGDFGQCQDPLHQNTGNECSPWKIHFCGRDYSPLTFSDKFQEENPPQLINILCRAKYNTRLVSHSQW